MTDPSQAAVGADAVSQLRLRVLVADDNAANRLVTERFLALMGCQSVSVASGREAVEAAGADVFDAILMDCQMPEMDGYQATEAIRATEEPGRQVPIIALTAAAYPEDLERGREVGMDGYITKPFLVSQLIEVLRSCTDT